MYLNANENNVPLNLTAQAEVEQTTKIRGFENVLNLIEIKKGKNKKLNPKKQAFWRNERIFMVESNTTIFF